MKVKELTINRLKHHSFNNIYVIFRSVYQKLFLSDKLSNEDVAKILSMVVLFTNQSDITMRRLGYRMALAYGNKTKDFTPLYDIAINSGLIPIVSLIKVIKDLPLNIGLWNKDSFLSNMVDSYIDNFKDNGITLTEGQYRLNAFFNKNIDSTATVIAPTSYGKSDLIISTIKSSENKRICIIVPSKSLLAQTRKRVLNAKIGWVKKFVIHPEMHNQTDSSSVYILTQERLTRILNQDKNVYFDIVIVDEAHNLLDKDGRNILLASVIRILDFRNMNTAFKFLTPFLKEASSLNIRNTAYQSSEFKINEYIKSELIFVADYRNGSTSWEFYDHFTHERIELENESTDYIAYICDNSASKNIVYFNRPKHIQAFAKKLADYFPVVNSNSIDEAVTEIIGNTHEKYLLLHCMKHGVLYHHGSMTDPIRNYVEYLYSTCDEFRYLISSSTLLEGVNLPIERMFLLSISKGRGNLRPSQFKNLIGRINRFNEIFNSPSLESFRKLQPEIHIVGTNEYIRANANLHKFCENVMRVTKKEKDIIENVLLEGTEINEGNEDEYAKAVTRLENLESGIIEQDECPVVSTEVGLKLLENNITEIDVFKSERNIDAVLKKFRDEEYPITDSNTLMSLIYDAFVSFIEPGNIRERNSLLRLKSDKAQTFYAMFLDWSIENAPLPVMIQRFVKYWERLPGNTPVYVGSWGDVEVDGEDYGELYTYMKGKTIGDKINLAIVRIKEEEDFFDYVIFRFVEILNELEFLDDTFYKLAKYGTTDERIITLIKNGFSRSVGELLLENYSNLVEFFEDDNVHINPIIHQRLKADKVGFFQRHEVTLNVIAYG
jgi:hypothetical protein